MSRVVLGLVALTLLSACGIKGDLARPDPLWNHEEAIRRECAEQAARNQPEDPRCAALRTGVQTTP
ncbi:MAG: lipoprotein [Hyphomonadaceae bacterium]